MLAVSATLHTRLDRLTFGEHCVNLLKASTLQGAPRIFQYNPIDTMFMGTAGSKNNKQRLPRSIVTLLFKITEIM